MLGMLDVIQTVSFHAYMEMCCNVKKVEIVVGSSEKNAIIISGSEKQVYLVGFLVHDEFLLEDSFLTIVVALCLQYVTVG
jgi:hypothetical protein